MVASWKKKRKKKGGARKRYESEPKKSRPSILELDCEEEKSEKAVDLVIVAEFGLESQERGGRSERSGIEVSSGRA